MINCVNFNDKISIIYQNIIINCS